MKHALVSTLIVALTILVIAAAYQQYRWNYGPASLERERAKYECNEKTNAAVGECG